MSFSHALRDALRCEVNETVKVFGGTRRDSLAFVTLRTWKRHLSSV